MKENHLIKLTPVLPELVPEDFAEVFEADAPLLLLLGIDI
jgi:hypothetical protein